MDQAKPHPSQQSLHALDTLNVVLADVRDGLGPYLTIYLTTKHWDPSKIGLAMSVMGIATVAAQTPAGALIDRSRHKRGWMIAASVLVALASVAMVRVPTLSVIMGSQTVLGVASAIFAPAIAAVSLGLVGHARMSRRMGRNEAWNHAGNVIAAILAWLIGDYVAYEGIFYLLAVMCGLSIVSTLMIRPEEIDDDLARGANEDRDGLPEITGIGELFKNRNILIFSASIILFHFANAAMLPLVGQKMTTGLDSGMAGYMSACIIAAQVVMVPVALASSRLAETWGRRPTFLIGFAVLPIRGLLYTFTNDPRWLVAIQLLDGIGAGIFGVVGVLVIADLTKGTGRFNLMQGALATATSIGASASLYLTGLIVSKFGFNAGFYVLAGIALAALAFYGLAMPETRPMGKDSQTSRSLPIEPQPTPASPRDMSFIDDPVTFVVPGDLHLTEAGLDNHQAALKIVDEINNLIRPDFVQFIGDNVQDATEAQFRLFDDLRQRLDAPHFALVGDHDVKGDPDANGFRARFGTTFGSTALRGFRFVRLDTQQSKPMGLWDAQVDWLALEIDDALASNERPVIFQHNYPYQVWENYDGPGVDAWRKIVQTRRIEAIVCGHTHYWQVANDGRNVAIAVRSVGDPEGGPPGYMVGHLQGNDFAIIFRTVEDQGPLVLVTHPRELILATSPAHIVSGRDRIEARVWSKSGVDRVTASINGGDWFALEHVKADQWSATLPTDSLPKGTHRLEVKAVDAFGLEGRHSIEFAVDPTGRYTAVPRVLPMVEGTAFC